VSKYYGADLVDYFKQWNYRNMVCANQHKCSRNEHLHIYAIGWVMRINDNDDNHCE
jgi:hypothetical protein